MKNSITLTGDIIQFVDQLFTYKNYLFYTKKIESDDYDYNDSSDFVAVDVQCDLDKLGLDDHFRYDMIGIFHSDKDYSKVIELESCVYSHKKFFFKQELITEELLDYCIEFKEWINEFKDELEKERIEKFVKCMLEKRGIN